MNPAAVSFSSDLANVMLGTPPEPQRAAFESMVVGRVAALLMHATSRQIYRIAPWIDERVLSLLSGRNLLHLAKIIEMRAPAAIENMPLLRAHQGRLRHGSEVSQIFSSRSLDLMIEVLSDDEARRAA